MLNPSLVRQFQVGLTTAADVKRALGDPAYENHNPDGRFIFMYKPGKYIYAPVFRPDDVLNKIVVFGKQGGAQRAGK